MGVELPSLSDIAFRESRNELTDYTVYKRLSGMGDDRKARAVFSRLAQMEHVHYNFWRRYCPGREILPHSAKVGWVLFLRRLLGPSFMIKYLEGTEAATIRKYESLRGLVPKGDRRQFNAMIADEGRHEQAFAYQVQGTYSKYVSFVVLGLADALVEVAGIHAGSLGIYNSTLLTGLAGIIAGAAASLSMASAAFAQAKQGFEGSASRAAAYTGVSYFIGAVILASPYFLTDNALGAIVASLVLGMCMIAGVSWYNSVMSAGRLRRDFLELAGVMVGVTIVLLMLGFVIRHVFGISI